MKQEDLDILMANTPTDKQYIINRKLNYTSLGDQLDNLFKDIEAGLFGESAKTSSFYTSIKTVKDTYPKPGV